MPRGKPFICWLDYEGRANDVPLYRGDSVWFRLKNRWVLGTIHCRKGFYKFRHRSREFCVLFTFDLRPAVSGNQENLEIIRGKSI